MDSPRVSPCPSSSSPQKAGLLGYPGGATGEAQDLEHLCEGAAVRGLGDEDGAAQQEHQEGDAEAGGGDDVAQLKAVVLLDVGHAAQGDDGPQVDAPVEPVEEAPGGLWASVLHLHAHTSESTRMHTHTHTRTHTHTISNY